MDYLTIIVGCIGCGSAGYMYARVEFLKRCLKQANEIIEGLAQQNAASQKPTVQPPDAKTVDSLYEERRIINEALLEVFDYLNDQAPFGSHQEGLTMCRNKLLDALQASTFRVQGDD